MNIYLLRHGETEENKKGTYYGKLDAELNNAGKIQAKRAAEYLREVSLDRVYFSERKRTRETAEIVLQANEKFQQQQEEVILIKEDKRLNELDFGIFEGKSYKEIQREYPLECIEWEKDWKGFLPLGGESFLQFYNRVRSFIEEIKESEIENVLLVTHAGVIKSLLCYILNENLDLFWKFASKNGDIALIKYEYGNFYIDCIQHV